MSLLKVIYIHGWVHRPLLHPVKVGRARFLRRLRSGQASFRSTVNHVHKGVNSFSAAIAAISSKMWARKDLKRLFCCFYLLVQHKTTQLDDTKRDLERKDDTKRDLERKGNVPVVGHLSSYF